MPVTGLTVVQIDEIIADNVTKRAKAILRLDEELSSKSMNTERANGIRDTIRDIELSIERWTKIRATLPNPGFRHERQVRT